MNEPQGAREIVPILFLGADPRFVTPGPVPPRVAEQMKEARGRDFRPAVRPADAPELPSPETDEVPKDSSATEPVSDSPDGQTLRSNPENPGGSADAEREQKPPTVVTPPVL